MPRAGDQLIMPGHLAAQLPGDEPFEAVMRLRGETVREATGRRTFRFSLNGRSYFAKVHTGVGWREVLKNVLRLRRPVVSAADEWRAIERIRSIGLDTVTPVAFGCRGRNPARLESFIITEDLGRTITLEVLGERWRDEPPEPRLRHQMIEHVAQIARMLHEAGMNHRDLYLCHFRVAVDEVGEPSGERLHLMDLHRAQIRRRVPARWRIKDIAGLYFSALDVGLTRGDVLRFMRAYTGDLRTSMRRDRLFWWRVHARATALYRSVHERDPQPPLKPMKGWWRG